MKIFIKRVYRKIKKTISPLSPLPNLSSVGLLYICAGKYDIFFDQFYKSFQRNFLPGAHKKYFVFTDSMMLKKKYASNTDIVFIDIVKKGWPYDTLLRNHYFYQQFDLFEGMHYLFFCNANMHCNEQVYLNDVGLLTGKQICGVLHPFYYSQNPDQFPVEKVHSCNAYFNEEEIKWLKFYFQGCFYGGSYQQFKELVRTVYEWTQDDLSQNKIPIWHDESYLNRYFYLNEPYALDPGFAYPGNAVIPFRKKIINLDKQKFGGHDFLRS